MFIKETVNAFRGLCQRIMHQGRDNTNPICKPKNPTEKFHFSWCTCAVPALACLVDVLLCVLLCSLPPPVLLGVTNLAPVAAG